MAASAGDDEVDRLRLVQEHIARAAVEEPPLELHRLRVGGDVEIVDEMVEPRRRDTAGIGKEELVCADRQRRGVPYLHRHDRRAGSGEVDGPFQCRQRVRRTVDPDHRAACGDQFLGSAHHDGRNGCVRGALAAGRAEEEAAEAAPAAAAEHEQVRSGSEVEEYRSSPATHRRALDRHVDTLPGLLGQLVEGSSRRRREFAIVVGQRERTIDRVRAVDRHLPRAQQFDRRCALGGVKHRPFDRPLAKR